MEFLEKNGVYKWRPHRDVRPTKKRLSRLRDALQRAFRLEENPIREYREPDGWRVVFHAYNELPEDRARPERK